MKSLHIVEMFFNLFFPFCFLEGVEFEVYFVGFEVKLGCIFIMFEQWMILSIGLFGKLVFWLFRFHMNLLGVQQII